MITLLKRKKEALCQLVQSCRSFGYMSSGKKICGNWQFTIDLKPYNYRDETRSMEPHRFFGKRSFSSFQQAMAEADRLFGTLDWRRMEDFNCRATVELICRKPKRR